MLASNQINLEDDKMCSYLLTGGFHSAPDRGSPDGHWYPITHSFSAESDSDAQEEAKRFLEDKYSYSSRDKEEFRNLKLVCCREVDLG